MARRLGLSDLPVDRLLLGFAAQPVAAGLIGYMLYPAFAAASGRSAYGSEEASEAAVSIALGAVLVAMPTTGLAAVLLVLRALRGPISFAETIAWGGVLGTGPLLALSALSGQATSHVFIRTTLAGSVFGFIGAALFWLFAIRKSVLDSEYRRLVRAVAP